MRNFTSIESLRAYMAWWVVLGHASHLGGMAAFLPSWVAELIERGDIAVNVFIIVSGFVITHLIQTSTQSYAPYLIRRFLRIFPIYVGCLILALAVRELYQAAYFHPWVFGVDMRVARATEEAAHFFRHLGLHLTLLHGVIPDSVLPFASSTFLAPAWSLSLEWQFYLVAPTILPLLRRSPLTMLSTVIVFLIVFALARKGVLGTWAYASFLPLSIHYFLIGILSRLLLDELQSRRVGAESMIVLSALVAMVAGPLEAAIWSVFFALTLVEMDILQIRSPSLKRIAHFFALNPIISRVGSWSYSTYLIHIPVYSVVVGTATLYQPAISQQRVIFLTIACVPLILLLSWCSFRFIEHPFNQLGRSIAKRMQGASASSGVVGTEH